MKKKFALITTFVLLFGIFTTGMNTANASYFEVLSNIGSTARTINSVNSAARGTLSTIEFSQRFEDRQQDRRDRKRTEKEYNQNAEQEYYKTLQETEALRNQFYRNSLNTDL